MTISTNITQQAHQVERELPDAYKEFADIFQKKDTDGLSLSCSNHGIQLKDTFIPQRAKSYPLNPTKSKVCKAFIKEHLKNSQITESQSFQASLFFFILKKDETLCPCQDYHYLNSHTLKNAHILPLISNLIDKLKDSKIFTKFDVHWEYNNILIWPEDHWKVAFSTPFGLYEPTVMFFSLCNSLATFQAYINHTFKDFIDKGWLIIYMNNMLIHSSNNLTFHQEQTHCVLQHLREEHLALKLFKSSFNSTDVKYLGLHIFPGAIKMDPTKLKAIQRWSAPTSVKAVQSFIRFCNFYQKFIPGFSTLAKPLLALIHKNAQWQWSVDHERAFLTIKEALLKQLVLAFPDHSKPFFIMTDTSLTTLGSVLMQKDSNGNLHPCAYFSKTFMPAKHNYNIYDQELLTVIHALMEWHQYLTSTFHPVTFLTDHKNLMYFKKPQYFSWCQACWQMFLQDYDLEWNHIPGTQMDPTDALSQKNKVDTSSNIKQILLPDLQINLLDTSITNQIAKPTPLDQFIVDILNTLNVNTISLPWSSKGDWYFDQGTLYYKLCLYIPEPTHHALVKSIHESLTGIHGGYFHTVFLLQKDYWWPNMTTFVCCFITSYATCQTCKVNFTHPTVPPLAPISSKCTHSFQQISMDLITDQPPSNGYDSILIMVDHSLSSRQGPMGHMRPSWIDLPDWLLHFCIPMMWT